MTVHPLSRVDDQSDSVLAGQDVQDDHGPQEHDGSEPENEKQDVDHSEITDPSLTL